ncbi:hypothetical protein N008_18375 [Hymenobacter sp. APR13]|nr:hypothetical protein N008_18375 [Hymenobacter sp. APR13]
MKQIVDSKLQNHYPKKSSKKAPKNRIFEAVEASAENAQKSMFFGYNTKQI